MQGASRRFSFFPAPASQELGVYATGPAWPARGLLGLPAGAVAHVLC